MIASESVRCAAAQAPPRPSPAACTMPAVPGSVPLLRGFARRVAAGWGLPEGVQDPLALVVTELATNAVCHSGGPDVALLLATDGFTVTVQVKDTGRWRSRPEPGAAGASDPDHGCRGRGLHLVQAFAATCEIRSTAVGTRVAVELVIPPPEP